MVERKPGRKQLTFDLNTNKMRKLGVYPNGYNMVRKELEKQGFKHCEDSVYVSEFGMSKPQALECMANVGAKHPWLDECLDDMLITSANRGHNTTASYHKIRAKAKAEAAKQNETTQNEGVKQPTHADQLLWVLENCRERIAEDIAANRRRQVGQGGQVQQVQQVGQGKSAAARKTRSK